MEQELKRMTSERKHESQAPQETTNSRGRKRSIGEIGSSYAIDEEKFDTVNDLPSNFNVKWDTHDAVVTVSLKDDDATECRICIVGRAHLKCLRGSLRCLGHEMTADNGKVMLTSPFWSNWTTIEITTDNTQFLLQSVRGTPSFRLAPPTRRPTEIPESWKTSADQIIRDCNNSSEGQRESLEDEILFKHDDPSIILICGAKGVGKSTFLRYLTNRLLSSDEMEGMLILDADVGQPELTPPGVLGLSIQKRPLLQTPYWNLTQSVESIASVFYGALTSKVNPTRYIEAVKYLIDRYRAFLSTRATPMPLLINLDGWIKGLGYEILTALISNIAPSHICQLLGESKGKTFTLENSPSCESFFLDACTNFTTTSSSVPSYVLRTLRLGAYFGPTIPELWDTLDFTPSKHLQGGWIDENCVLAEYLARERPYFVPFEAVNCSFIDTDRQDLTSEQQILNAMNGNIVGLCDGNANNCLGLGLVRSIDWKRRVLYILSPVKESILPQVTSLVGGNLPLPLSFVFRGVHAESFPYQTMIQLTAESPLGADPMKSRNNIGRKGISNDGGKF